MASWWLVPPGWEPDFVSLAPSLTLTIPLAQGAPSTQNFSKLGVVYIKVLGLANQVVPHTGTWFPWATAVNYLAEIVTIFYMTFQA